MMNKTPSGKILLSLFGLPPISSLDDLSKLTHLSKKLLFRLSSFGEKNYFVYQLPKKGGGYRTIAQPSKELKAVQAWILRNILENISVSSACRGFQKKTNITDNAKPHIGANAVMCLDLEDFFPSIKINKVWSIFRTIGYNPRISSILAKLCTFNGALPQGSPASPKLSNLVCLRMDYRIMGYVSKKGIIFTRYADDLTFSAYTTTKLIKIFSFINKIISSEDFKINKAKTRFAGASRQHKVTGLVVTQFEVGIGRKKLREIRSKIHHLCKLPNDGATVISDVNHLKGWLSFIRDVDGNRSNILNNYILTLRAKYPSSAITFV